MQDVPSLSGLSNLAALKPALMKAENVLYCQRLLVVNWDRPVTHCSRLFAAENDGRGLVPCAIL